MSAFQKTLMVYFHVLFDGLDMRKSEFPRLFWLKSGILTLADCEWRLKPSACRAPGAKTDCGLTM